LKKVLLADDSRTFLNYYGKVFAPLGIEVVEAASGTEAIEQAWKEKPSLILLDLEMPGMSGAECARLLKQDPTCKAIPIVLITQHISQKDMDVMVQSGCEEILAKPVSPLQLRGVIQRYLK
jgi:CheY-like chemotaxis protein